MTSRALVRSIVSVATFAMLATGRAGAQTPLRVDDLQVTGTPALTLLGVAATAVESPNTPRSLITNLVSAAGQTGVIPNGASLETAPYWLTPHDGLTLERYYRASLPDRLRYFTAFSFASARVAAGDGDTANTRVAIALRTLLKNGHPSRALHETDSMLGALETTANVELRAERAIARDLQKALQAVDPAHIKSIGDVLPRIAGLRDSIQLTRDSLAAAVATLDTLVARGASNTARAEATARVARALTLQAALRQRVDRVERASAQVAGLQADSAQHDQARITALDAIPARAKEYAEATRHPAGLVFEVAVGTRAEFARSLWTEGHSDGAGVWITPSYHTDDGRFALISIGRLLTNVREFEQRDLVDGGLKAVFTFNKLDVGGEYVSRWLFKQTSHTTTSTGSEGTLSYARTDRWSANANYPLTGDLTLAASFGSDYRRPAGERPVIATLGINLGLGAIELRSTPAK
jgi:hypothetical protein